MNKATEGSHIADYEDWGKEKVVVEVLKIKYEKELYGSNNSLKEFFLGLCTGIKPTATLKSPQMELLFVMIASFIAETRTKPLTWSEGWGAFLSITSWVHDWNPADGIDICDDCKLHRRSKNKTSDMA